jgi:uncharacterized delta-60 repeat protein
MGRALLASLLGLVLLPTGAGAFAGGLDAGYGTDGRTITNVGDTPSGPGAPVTARDASGRLLVASGEGPLVVRRLLSGGAPDTAFGHDGVAFAGRILSDGRPSAIAVDSQQRILVAGYTYRNGDPSAATPIILRLLPGGALDRSFSFEGAPEVFPAALRVDGQDRPILGGGTAGGDYAMERLTTSGQPDETFAPDGVVKVTVSGTHGAAADFGPGGELVVAGMGAPDADDAAPIAVVRFSAAGVPAAGFGTGGTARFTEAQCGCAFTPQTMVALAPDGHVFVAVEGQLPGGPFTPRIHSLTATGAPQAGFGTGGEAIPAVGDNVFEVALIADAASRPVLLANRTTGADDETLVVRLTTAGVLDTGFDGDGQAVEDVDTDQPASVREDAGGLLVAGAPFATGASSRLALLRLTGAGARDTSFAGDGELLLTTTLPSRDAGAGSTVDAQGRLIVVGTTDASGSDGSWLVVRYTAQGQPDPAFGGGDGIARIDPGAVLGPLLGGAELRAAGVDAQGRVLLAGSWSGQLAVARLTPGGALDTTFGGDGFTDPAPLDQLFDGLGLDLAVDASNRPVVSSETGGEVSVRRYTTDGAPDTSFAGDGSFSLAIGASGALTTGIALDASGRAVVGTCAELRSGAIRLNADGTQDLGFGNPSATTNLCARDLAVDANGVLIAGSQQVTSATFTISLSRFTPAGQVDTAYGDQGTAALPPGLASTGAGSVALDSAGRAVVGGSLSTGFGIGNGLLVRLTPTGAVDTTFDGNDGLVTTDYGGDSDGIIGLGIAPDGGILAAGSTASLVRQGADADVVASRYTGTSGPGAQHTLTVVVQGGTSEAGVTAPGIACPGTCTHAYPAGESVTLAAGAYAGAHVNWSGADCEPNQFRCPVTLDQDRTVTAGYGATPHSLVLGVDGEAGSGRIAGAGADCADQCVRSLPGGTAVSLTAVPATGFVFAGWTGACPGATTPACAFTLDADRFATARFERPVAAPTWMLTAAVQGTGVGSISGLGIACPGDCAETVADGTKVTLVATPTGTSSFEAWTGCDAVTGTSCEVTLTSARNVDAFFHAPDITDPGPTGPTGPVGDPTPTPTSDPGGGGTTAPDTRILSFKRKRHKATVTFAGGTTYQCRLDKRPWKACTSPLRLTRLKRGRHTLRVAVAGDSSPAVKRFRVRR